MLDAIRSATRSINMECYIFQPGTDRRPVHRRAGRARPARRQRHVVVDAIGSFNLWGRPLRRLREAGCRVESYQRMRVAPAGAAQQPHAPGAARSWTAGSRSSAAPGSPTGGRIQSQRRGKPWRDTMARIEGPVVAALQGVAAENWLECCGEIITGPEYFPNLEAGGRHDGVRRSRARRRTARRRRAWRSSC